MYASPGLKSATHQKSPSQAMGGSPKKTVKKNLSGGQRKRKTLHGEEAEGSNACRPPQTDSTDISLPLETVLVKSLL